jgi:putative endonuclease
MVYYTYILQCSDQTLYVGSTNDLEHRIHAHNNLKSGAHYTKIRRPVTLVYSESYATLRQALQRECEIKSWKKEKKIALIQNTMPSLA